MEKMKKVPALRFPGFEGEWNSHTLGDVATFSKGKGVAKADIADDGGLECIRYGELYTHYGETISVIRSKTYLLQEECVLSQANDVIIPASGESQLDIATASCVLKSGVALGGDLNIIRSPIDGVFLSYYLNNKKKHEIAALAQGISVVHLYSSQLKTLNLNLPTRKEQEKIASFLAAIDDKIQQLQKKESNLEQYKKGVMHQVFDQKIRFKDDNGKDYPDWEKKKLGEVFLNRVEKNKDGQLLSVTINSGVRKQSDMIRRDSSNKDKSAYLHVKAGDIVYNSMRMWQGASGKSLWDGIVSPAYTVLETKEGYDVNFFTYMFKLSRMIQTFQRNSQGLTSDTWNLKYSKLKEIKALMPSLQEQIKIAQFLSNIDERIDHVNQQLEKTKQFKKGLLQQMFV